MIFWTSTPDFGQASGRPEIRDRLRWLSAQGAACRTPSPSSSTSSACWELLHLGPRLGVATHAPQPGVAEPPGGRLAADVEGLAQVAQLVRGEHEPPPGDLQGVYRPGRRGGGKPWIRKSGHWRLRRSNLSPLWAMVTSASSISWCKFQARERSSVGSPAELSEASHVLAQHLDLLLAPPLPSRKLSRCHSSSKAITSCWYLLQNIPKVRGSLYVVYIKIRGSLPSRYPLATSPNWIIHSIRAVAGIAEKPTDGSGGVVMVHVESTGICAAADGAYTALTLQQLGIITSGVIPNFHWSM